MASHLEDLDELALRCRDKHAKANISEAVSCYRAGAFRSAIVATWVAVCFDVIEKLRELALAGDQNAEQQIQDLETTRRTGDLLRALKFEREILSLAKDTFELISPLEYTDLERLQADRNRCAHPSLTSDEQAYNPSAELARVHLHSAVTHLLQHPPVQGKFALTRLLGEINSEYFPTSAKDAHTAFSTGPLRKPRDSLVRNLTLVLAKTLLTGIDDYKKRLRHFSALVAVMELHPRASNVALTERLSQLIRVVPDDGVFRATEFLVSIPNAWSHLDVDVRQRLQNYVRDLPVNRLEDLSELLNSPLLRTDALERVRLITSRELDDTLFWDLPTEVADRYIDAFVSSETFDEANKWAKHMAIYSRDFSPAQVRRIIEEAATNSQCRGSFKFEDLMKKLRSLRTIPVDAFDAILTAHNIDPIAAS